MADNLVDVVGSRKNVVRTAQRHRNLAEVLMEKQGDCSWDNRTPQFNYVTLRAVRHAEKA